MEEPILTSVAAVQSARSSIWPRPEQRTIDSATNCGYVNMFWQLKTIKKFACSLQQQPMKFTDCFHVAQQIDVTKVLNYNYNTTNLSTNLSNSFM